MRDLCERLMVVAPEKRLGSGPPGSPLGFDVLKRHEFFKGVNFDTIRKTDPPIDLPTRVKLNADKKKVVSGFESPTEMASSSSISSDSCEDEEEKTAPVRPQTQNPQEKVIREGIVDKKCGWVFYYNRKLVLTTLPRLSYYSPKTNEYKVEQNWHYKICRGTCSCRGK